MLTIPDIYKFKLLKFFFKLFKNTVLVYFSSPEFLILQQTTHPYNTRTQAYIIPRIHHVFAEKCIRHQLPGLLNTTPTFSLDKVNMQSETGYTSYLKKILNKYVQ